MDAMTDGFFGGRKKGGEGRRKTEALPRQMELIEGTLTTD
jgi:hypothetical protein